MKTQRLLYRGLVAVALGLLLSPNAKAQDPEFSQFYATPVYTNPAMAGTGTCNGGGRMVINYRNQWPSLPGTFQTTVASYDQHFENVGGGFGVILLNDVAGEGLLTTNQASFVYSYLLRVSKKLHMRFGLEGQIMQRNIDWSKLRWPDQIDATRGFVLNTQEPPPVKGITSPNFNLGYLLYTEGFYAGVAVHNVIEPVQSFYGDNQAKLPRRYTAHLGSVIPLDKRPISRSEVTFSPNALFMMQGQFTQLNFGFYMNRGPLVSGLWFRQTLGEVKNSDALMLLVGFRKEKFKFGYSFDLTVDSKKTAAKGSHEISAAIEWCAKPPRKIYKPLRCPDF
ncbi:MAG: type IX secretion system membrane protein PorP/SprF [Flavobacteriales bacterium]|nr:type IX secretion system membrane protein PorP/SprF [Flavobacteriales bacterium]